MYSSSLHIYQESPNECDAKPDKDDTIDPVYDMNVVWREPVADLSRQHHLGNIRL
jgi:hypothetical protein